MMAAGSSTHPRRVGAAPRAALPLLLLALAAGCRSPLLDEPDKVRRPQLRLPPLVSYARSDDGTSWSWSALLWLLGASREGERRATRVLPFYWSASDADYARTTLLFPLYYARTTPFARTRFYSLLYGWSESEELRSDYVPLLLSYRQASKQRDAWRSGVGSGLLYDWRHDGERDDVVVLSLLGLATGLRMELGHPADGVAVPALGRDASRRIVVGDLLGLVTLFGYDDVGDRREWRLLTLFSSEMLSPIRSWRGRGDDPFVREWVFPLYMNVRDEDGGFAYVGPFWGRRDDVLAGRHTDWWALGLLSRTRGPDGTVWRVAGLPVAGP